MGELLTMPYEIIEHIAFFLAVDPILGPPSALLPFLLLHRRMYYFLRFDSNAHLYCRIFAAKFDTEFPVARFRQNRPPVAALAGELKRRCIYLKRIRDQLDCFDLGTGPKDSEHLKTILGIAYLMMLENGGKNEAQLRNYAQIDSWIRRYWFNDGGSSGARADLTNDSWPRNDEMIAAGMWILWIFFRPDDYIKDKDMKPYAEKILKLYALGAHRYPLSHCIWSEYSPPEAAMSSVPPFNIAAYGELLSLTPLPVGTPATLAYLSIYTKMRTTLVSPRVVVSDDRNHPQVQNCDWQRSLISQNPDEKASSPSMLGSFDGVWEGIFTYAEFEQYIDVLRGGPPSSLVRSLDAQHRQTWKIREHVLWASDEGRPLSIGDPLHAFFPVNARIKENLNELIVEEFNEMTRYSRYYGLPNLSEATALDIIVTGEGHSAWGQFKLLGRVRPCDGLIVLSKQYHEGDRGSWLYRGYIIGGNFVGRWRDTISPIHMIGYEGCFIMGRRK